MAAAKKPGAVSYASVGAGSSNHLAAELFHQTAGSSGMHIPFKGGGPAPNVPAVAETYKGFEVYSWVGMVAPAKTPGPVLDRLAADMAATLHDPEVSKRLTERDEVTATPNRRAGRRGF